MVRFGFFSFDHPSGELRKNGRIVKLYPQAGQVLSLLLEHAGSVVSREQIRAALWNDETFVDYDLGINSCVRQVRAALDDDAEAPRYVQTIPRKGYRFIAPIETASPSPVPPRASRRYGMIAAGIVVGALSAIAFWGRRPSAPLTDSEADRRDAKPFVAVLPFDHLTGDSSLDWLRTGIPEMLVTDLSQSQDLNVLSTDRLVQILQDSGHAEDILTSEAAVREVTERAGSDTVILGSFLESDETLRIDARVQHATDGEILRTVRVEGRREASLFAMVDELTVKVRAGLSLPVLDATVHFPGPLSEYTTASVDAYRYFAEATMLLRRSKSREALALYEKAIEEDPSWAHATMMVSMMHNNLGHEREAQEYARRAVALAEGLDPRHRYDVEGWYYALREETYGDAIQSLEALIALNPTQTAFLHLVARRYFLLERVPEAIDRWERLRKQGALWMPLGQLASAYDELEQFDEAHQVIAEFLTRFPDRAEGIAGLGDHWVRRGRLDAALDAYDAADAVEPARHLTDLGRFRIAVLREQWNEAERALENLLTVRSGLAQLRALHGLAVLELYRGKSDRSLAVLERAIQRIEEPTSQRASLHIDIATVRLYRGEAPLALEAARLAQSEGQGDRPEWEGLFYEALAQAARKRSEDADRAAEKLRDRTQSIPSNKEARRYHHLVGELRLSSGDADIALDAFDQAQSMLLPRGFYFPMVAPPQHIPIWYGMARAHLAAGHLENAFEWFTRITESENERIDWPVLYVRSHFFLAQICESRGEVAASREHYRKFYAYWKDGDLDRDRVDSALAAISPEVDGAAR